MSTVARASGVGLCLVLTAFVGGGALAQERPQTQAPNPLPFDAPAQGTAPAGPFEGEIVQVVETPLSKVGLSKARIVITVGRGRVRRDVEGRGLARGHREGLIVDVARDRVVVYRESVASKRYIELSLAGYRDFVDGAAPTARPWQSAFNPLFFQYDGARVFRDETASWEGDTGCRRKELRRDDEGLEVLHCPALAVPRALLALTDPHIPDVVVGFPVRLREGVYRAARPDAGPASSDGEKVARKLRDVVDRAADALDVLVRQELRTESVARRTTTDADFEPPAGFLKSTSLDPPPSSSGGGFDWD